MIVLTAENGDKQLWQVLFDMVTHTKQGCVLYSNTASSIFTHSLMLYRNDGVGDLGKEGINTFLEHHECREICEALGLAPVTGVTSTFPDFEDESLDNPDHLVCAREEVEDILNEQDEKDDPSDNLKPLPDLSSDDENEEDQLVDSETWSVYSTLLRMYCTIVLVFVLISMYICNQPMH